MKTNMNTSNPYDGDRVPGAVGFPLPGVSLRVTDPETTTSWDIGVEQKLWKGAKIGVTYFDNYIDGLIYSTATDASLTLRISTFQRLPSA